jgi:hypothetical protein
MKKSPFKATFSCAEGGTRTRTPVKAHAPETCVSTNFTTSAKRLKVPNLKLHQIWNNKFEILNLLVPRTGLEPAHLAALPPQSSVSTNFTTWALNNSANYRVRESLTDRPARRQK